MFDILGLAAPIYLLIGAGFILVRSGYFPAPLLGALGQFTLKCCVPVIIFSAVSAPGSLSALNWSFILGYAGAALIVVAAVALILRHLFGKSLGLSIIFGLGSASANSVFLGLPIATIVLDDLALTLFAWIMIAENLLVIPLCVSLAESADTRSGRFTDSFKAILGSFLRSPLMVALVAGLLVSLLGVAPPAPLAKTISMIAAAAPALSLFLVGGYVASEKLRGLGPIVGLTAVAKLVLHPAMAALVLSLLPGVTDAMVIGGALFASAPMFSIFTIFAGRHGGEALASATLVLTTIAAAVTVNVMLVIAFALL